MVLILKRQDVESVLQMADCIDILEKAFAELSSGTAVLPLRIGITAPDGLSLYMPAYLQGMNALACKVVSVYKKNPEKHGLPTTIGKVLLQDPETGDVLCIMDGGYLTAMRTGAVSGLATKFLAREDPGQVAAIFGAGVQARMQLWAVCEARDDQPGDGLRRGARSGGRVRRRRWATSWASPVKAASTARCSTRTSSAPRPRRRRRSLRVQRQAGHAHQRHRQPLARRARAGQRDRRPLAARSPTRARRA